MVIPLMLLAVGMGVFPRPFLERLEPSATRLVARATRGPVTVPGGAVAAQPQVEPEPPVEKGKPMDPEKARRRIEELRKRFENLNKPIPPSIPVP